MDNPDIRVDIAHHDARDTRTLPQDVTGGSERSHGATAHGAGWVALSPTARRALVGNPRRVRL